MPIYAYRCNECGFAKDVLQKISDPELTDCPSCGKAAFTKQVTAAGFQLKGSGWYVTDFKGGSGGNSASAPGISKAESDSGSTSGTSEAKSGSSDSSNSNNNSSSNSNSSPGSNPATSTPSSSTQ